MSREQLVAIGAALVLAAVVVYAYERPNQVLQSAPTGFTTLGSVSDADFPSLPAAASIASTSAAAPRPAATTSKQTAAPAPVATPSVDLAALNETVGLVRGVLVNIICVPSASNLKAASATGVVIDPRGIILTVAHMAQFYLLADYPKRDGTYCVIRTGSPAKTAYTASLIYISPEWVKNNASVLTQATPIGTGEDDFALLAITGSATNDPLPSSFTAIPLSNENPPLQESVTLGSYGAEFLVASQIKSSLYPIVVFSTITDRFTFHASTEDLIAVTNTAAAQEGSSGGVLVNAKNETTGLITTSTNTGSVTNRTLHAITGNYIQRAFKAETGKDLLTYLQSPIQTLVQEFKDPAAGLTSYLQAHIQ